MKKIILIFTIFLMIGCAPTGVQVTFDDEKSTAIKAAYEGYLANDYSWAETLYSPDIAVHINNVEAIDLDANIAGLASHHELFSNISMSHPSGGDAFVQTTNYNDDTGIWSNAWFIWKGTGKVTGNTIEVPCHVAYQWNDEGQVTETWLFSDQAPLLAEVNAAQAVTE